MFKNNMFFFILLTFSISSQALVNMETKEYTQDWYELKNFEKTRSYKKNAHGVFGKNQCSIFDLNSDCSFKKLSKKELKNNHLLFHVEKGKVVSFSKKENFFRLRYDGDKVSEIISSQNKVIASFKYKNELLILATNEWGNSYSYEYLDSGLLFKTTYPDKTFEEILYNSNQNVVSFLRQDKCIEKYTYSDSLSYSKAITEKFCDNKKVLSHIYEFWRDSNNKLTRVKSNKEGEISDISYKDNLPIEVFENNQHFKYTYYKNGLMKTKEFGKNHITFTYNKSNMLKNITFVDLSSQKTNNLIFSYSGKNITKIHSSDGIVNLRIVYNEQGLITEFFEHNGEHLLISYENKFNKPERFELKNVGSLLINYLPNGEIENVNGSLRDDKTKKILKALNKFSNYLDFNQL